MGCLGRRRVKQLETYRYRLGEWGVGLGESRAFGGGETSHM